MNNISIVRDEDSRKPNNLIYSEPLERIIAQKAEECEIISHLHLLTHRKLNKQETSFNVPIIAVTAIVGFLSALDIQFSYMNIVIGLASLSVSLLKSIFTYLQISQKSENHRVAYLQYYQISNEIKIELSLARDIRQPANYLLNLIKIKMKNLNEVSELIPDKIIEFFKQKYGSFVYSEGITLPDILGAHRKIEICDWNNQLAFENDNSKSNECVTENVSKNEEEEEDSATNSDIENQSEASNTEKKFSISQFVYR